MEGVLYKGKEMKAQIAHCQVIEGELALDTMNEFFKGSNQCLPLLPWTH